MAPRAEIMITVVTCSLSTCAPRTIVPSTSVPSNRATASRPAIDGSPMALAYAVYSVKFGVAKWGIEILQGKYKVGIKYLIL